MNYNENDPVTVIGCRRKRKKEITSICKKTFSVEDDHPEYSELVAVKNGSGFADIEIQC